MKKIFSALLFSLVLCLPAFGSEYIRVTKDKQGIPQTLETASVVYKNGDTTVEVIGAIHIADKAYYKKLNEQFKQYDCLLYELVAQKNAVPNKSEGFDIYKILGQFLDLEGQLNVINYKAKNFIHADLTPQELSKAIEARGYDNITLALSVLVDMMKDSNKQKKKAPKVNIANLKCDDQAIYYKRIMALSMEEGSDNMGATMQSILVEDRNIAAMDILRNQIKQGKTKIGIFYGAAHMADFDKRITDLGFKKVETNWNCAWDLRP